MPFFAVRCRTRRCLHGEEHHLPLLGRHCLQLRLVVSWRAYRSSSLFHVWKQGKQG
jgi:hypothetical protein